MSRRSRGRARLAAAALVAAGVAALAGCGASHPPATSSPRAGAASASPPAATVVAGDSPAGFWFGTDSSGVTTPGPAPFRAPAIGSAYGGYVGMIGNWAGWQGCGGQVIWSAADAASARADLARYHAGIGVAGYWFMAGPGTDPRYDGSTAEAARWGAAQAAAAIADLGREPAPVNYPVIFMDVEVPGHAPQFTPADDNGWNSAYSSACSGRIVKSSVPASADRADIDGFAAYLRAHSHYQPGVYSAPSVWGSIFGTGASARLTGVYEWTYNGLTGSLASRPAGWCLPGTRTCAQFFGGLTSASKYAVMWQWSGGGGVRNGVGDFDQIDAARTPAASGSRRE